VLAHQLSLGQLVDAKSNEITAIPELLKMLEIEGALITLEPKTWFSLFGEVAFSRASSYGPACQHGLLNTDTAISLEPGQ